MNKIPHTLQFACLGLALVTAGCRTPYVPPDSLVTRDHIAELADEVVASYLDQVERIIGPLDDSLSFSLMDANSEVRGGPKLTTNLERWVTSAFTKDRRVQLVPKGFVQEGLRVAKELDKFPYAVNPRNPQHFQTPAVQSAFMEVMQDKGHPVTHLAWIELSSMQDDLMLYMSVMDLREGVVSQPVHAEVRVRGLAVSQL